MEWLGLIGMTIGHTFWLFYLAGDIPGTVEHRRRHEESPDSPSEEGCASGSTDPKTRPEGSQGVSRDRGELA